MDRLLKALAEPTRRRVMESLHRKSPSEMTVDDAAREFGLDRTTAFDHLESLRAAGLLIAGERRTGWRGRPARTYRPSRTAQDFSVPARQHRLLATILGEAIGESGPTGLAAAHEFGRRVGARIAADTVSSTVALELLDELGGDYEATGNSIRSGNCIFREACQATPHPVACHAQAGLLEGVLAFQAPLSRVTPEGTDDRGGCSYHVEAI